MAGRIVLPLDFLRQCFAQTYRGDMTIGSYNGARSWTGLDDVRGGTIWTIKPGPAGE